MRIDLGDGQWAEVREVDDLRDEDRVKVNSSWSYGVDPETKKAFIPGDADDQIRRALAALVITGWNLAWPLPSKRPDSLGKLTLGQARKLYLGLQPHLDVLNGKDADPSEPGSDPTADSSS